jgi:glycerophosphoryl diester phosphodiesterase
MTGTVNMYADHLVAHRGYPRRFPENTLPSVEAAIQAGARFIEVDIQLSQDGIPVVFHDRDLQRLCGQGGAVADYSLQQLKTIPVRDPTRFDNRFEDIFIPRLTELVELLQNWPDVTLFVELKRNSLQHFGTETVVTAVLPELQPVKTQCVLISYAIDALQHVTRVSEYPIGAVFDDWAEHARAEIHALEPAYLFCDIDSLPSGDIPVPTGRRLAVYECTDPQQALAVLSRGVTLVETFAIGEMLTQMQVLGAALGA